MASYLERVQENIGHINETCRDNFTAMRQLDEAATELESALDEAIQELPLQGKPAKKVVDRIILLRTATEEAAEKKISLTTATYDVVDSSIHFVDEELKILERVMRVKGIDFGSSHTSSQPLTGGNGRKRRNSALSNGTAQAATIVVDPNEPRYCVCQNVAYGEMIACDNPECKVEWFHFGCVGMTRRPHNQWFCPVCMEKKKRQRPGTS